jgi:hypothetical protein
MLFAGINFDEIDDENINKSKNKYGAANIDNKKQAGSSSQIKKED